MVRRRSSPPVALGAGLGRARISGSWRPATPFRSPALLTASLTLLAACSDAPPPEADHAAPTVTVDTVAGVPRVTSEGEPPVWRLEEVLVLGSVGGLAEPAPDEFGRAVSVALGPERGVWVADQIAQHVKVFAPDGRLIRTVGRAGEGPGEFGSPSSLAWMGDTLMVLDHGVGRVGLLSPEGEWLGQLSAVGRLTGPPSVLRLHQVGPRQVWQRELESRDGRLESVWVLHGPGGVLTRRSEPDAESSETAFILCEGEGWISSFEVPFAARNRSVPAPDGLMALVDARRYRIRFVDPEGDTVRIVERVREPVPLRDEEWEAGLEEYREAREERPGMECDPARPPRPAHKSPVAGVFVDATGRTWVEVSDPEGTHWEVFDEEGRLAGRLDGLDPHPRTVPWIDADEAAWITADTLDVRRVRVARIVR